MYGQFCLVPRVSVHDRYYCISLFHPCTDIGGLHVAYALSLATLMATVRHLFDPLALAHCTLFILWTRKSMIGGNMSFVHI